ncbi:ABC transporter permease [Sedimentitalea todarodis]|uniref:ABC transporter permease n=1 Tax=Sedimentitalea todarodis TaxID=1631240 RepID=A0ABU3VIJ9_9RHOB|nr:ABC transporter permease [Sedimentitalea todarodis]MDU9006017.1 ABC transporter permease [Sedimentitalea todarodis]
MPSSIRQIIAMSRAALLSLPRRLAISLSMIASIMLVVCVLSAFLATARGFEVALQSAGSPDVAVILGSGARHEGHSEISADTIRALIAIGGDIGVVRESSNAPLISRELVVPVEYRSGDDAAGETLALRGMDSTGPGIRQGVTLSSGHFATSGSREIVVGDQLAASYPGFGIGDQVRLGPVAWTVAGHFSARGSAFESEIWADLDTVRGAFNRAGEVQSLRLRLVYPNAIDTLRQAADSLPDTQLRIISEADLYAGQSEGTAQLIRLFGWPIALLMAAGAVAGALNTMMSSLSDRTVEIATVRALGFSRLSALLATWLEAMLLATVGVGLGLAVSWFGLNGWQASTLGANDARMAFQLVVDADVMVMAGLVGITIGAIGGLLPALAAARLPITAALRARG